MRTRKNSVNEQFLRNVGMEEMASNQHKRFRGLFSDIFGIQQSLENRKENTSIFFEYSN